MIIGIDATNIKSEGGIVHLFEIINNSNFQKFNIKKIHVWGNNKCLIKINNNKIIKKHHVENLTTSLLKRIFWQKFILPKELKKNSCSILFVPGGLLFNNNLNSVLVFQNILPFLKDEVSRYNLFSRLKFFVQRKMYLKSFKYSDGIIFLSNFSKKKIEEKINLNNKKTILIPHGISNIFKFKKKKINSKKIKLIYVSKFDIYKNQLELVDIFYKLKRKISVHLTLIGNSNINYKKKIKKKIKYYNLENDIRVLDNINYKNLPQVYNKHDIKIYPSKAETFGLTMLEAIRCGLPTLALKSEISKEILSDAGFYYSNLNNDLQKQLIYILKNKKIVDNKIKKGTNLSNNYSWKKSSDLTFFFLKRIQKIEK